jgi:recombination protein RecA
MAKKIIKETNDKFQETIDNLNKKYGVGSILALDSKTGGDYDVISTGSISFDYITLGVGGFVKGKLYELMGWEGTGKSTICGHAAAECQKAGGTVLYIDGEHAVDKNYFKKLGVDTTKMLIAQPSCVWEEELILTSSGNISFKLIEENHKVASVTNNQIYSNFAKNLVKSEKIGIKIKTSRGCFIASEDHKVKTFNGYKAVKDLNTSDFIEIPYKHSLFNLQNKTELNVEKCFILGAFLGDGNYNRSTVRFYGIDKDLIENLLRIIKFEFPNTTWKQESDRCISFSRKDKTKKGKSDLAEFLHTYLGKVSKKDKFIPKEIFNAGKLCIEWFIGGLIMTDGSIEKSKISFSNYTKHIITDFSSLLSFLSIPHTLYEKNRNKFEWYEINIQNKEGIDYFKNYIPLTGYKKEKLDSLKTGDSFVRFPKELWNIIFEEIKLKYKTITEFSNLYFNKNYKKHLFNTKRGISHEYLVELNKILKSEKLDELIKSDVAYAKIINIVNTNQLFPMLDVTVSDSHNFIVNNHVVHNCGEEGFNIAMDMINTGKIDLVIIDSDSSLIPKKMLDGDVGDSTIGRKALLNSNAYPKLKGALSQHNVCVIVISQYREKIGVMFGNPTTTQGGHALKFYSDVRIEVSRTLAKDGDVNYGNITKLKAIKNKMSPPYRKSEFEIVYGVGIDKLDEMMSLLNEYDLGRKYGKTMTVNGTKYDLEEFKQLVVDNPEFYDELREKIIAKINETDLPVEEIEVEEEELVVPVAPCANHSLFDEPEL